MSLRLLVCVLWCAGLSVAQEGIEYPESPRGEVVETIHGVEVADPYRWLEDDVRVSKDVAEWVSAQNVVTRGFLDAIPQREAVEERLRELWDYERSSAPFRTGDSWFFFKNDGLQNQSVFCRLLPDGSSEVVIDPNTWSDDGTKALAGVAPSPDCRYLAYGVQESGSDWRSWRILDLESGKLLDDRLDWIKFSSVSWARDGKSFVYGRYPATEEGEAFQSLNQHQKIYHHRVGTPQSEDVLVHERRDHPNWGFSPEITDDGRYLVIIVWKGTDARYRVLVKDLEEPLGMLRPLFAGFDDAWDMVGNDGSVFYFRTDLDAPKGRIVAVDLRKPEVVRELVPETEDTIRSVGMVGDLFVVSYLHDASSLVRVHRRDGRLLHEIELPGIGTASGFSGHRSDDHTYFSFSSFATPPSIHRLDTLTGKTKLIRSAKVDFDPDDYSVEQVFATSKDGTKVPVFLAWKKKAQDEGPRPCLLYGYGGFNISLTPSFSISRLHWMEMGGLLAVANLRGGGEYGEAWHEAGTKLRKQNVFDDFIAVAEHLVATGRTSKRKLAIQGGSNGGLLVGACMTQRPDLFAACLPAVGVMDMVRFERFTAGRFWTDDYGSVANEDEFKALLAYSPCHNLEAGRSYPATLVTTADTDDRVVPAHSFKFAAALQAAQAGSAPTLIRIETSAGHGAGKPTSKAIEEVADQWSFLIATLGMAP